MNTIPTSHGNLTADEIVDHLTWKVYKEHRDKGSSHELLAKLGIGNDQMKARYEALKN